ncbi:MAG: TatD family hydrolase [Trichloromonas sp.]|jgi:TatD DNase family protein|nr:TatD family hydrolase [Trichloromonas sp.]
METAPPFFFDTHAHLDFPPLRERLEEELAQARAAGVGAWVVPGVRPDGWPALLATVAKVPEALAAPGVHPLAAADWNEETAAALTDLLHTAVAVGEIGLDGTLSFPSQAVQERAFRDQVRLAVAARRPLLIHCRKAMGRTLEILRAEGAQRVGGIFHAFSGSPESAREALRLNFAIGLGGALTFTGARRGPELARILPAEWLVLESDAPDLAPEPYRGQINRPAYLPLMSARLANLRSWSPAETAAITTDNARRVLGLHPY